MSKLYFRYGVMNSGKTTQLLQLAYNYEERGMKISIFKPKVDTKAQNKISSRIGLEREADFLIESETNIKHILKECYKNGVSCI